MTFVWTALVKRISKCKILHFGEDRPGFWIGHISSYEKFCVLRKSEQEMVSVARPLSLAFC